METAIGKRYEGKANGSNACVSPPLFLSTGSSRRCTTTDRTTPSAPRLAARLDHGAVGLVR